MTAKKRTGIVQAILPKSKFARSVSLLAGGAAAGQAIVVVASPVLTRLYSPEDFGVLAVFASLLGILGVVASLRYQLAIPLPKTDEEAANISVLSLCIILGMALLAALIVIPFRHPIAEVMNVPLLAGYFWLLPLGLLLVGTYEVFNYWAIRKKAFGVIAKTKFTQSLGMVGVQVGGYSLGLVALLVGRIFGQAAGIVKLGAVVMRSRQSFSTVSFSGLVYSFKRYRSFPLISTWSGLSSAGGSQLPPLLIAIMMGPAAAGLYALTSRVLSLPVGVISKSMGDVFYGEAIEANGNGKLGSLVVDIYSKMVFVGLPIGFVIVFAAPEVFRFLFGDSWASAGELASWMVIGVFFQFVTTPAGKVFLILERHGYALFFQVAFLSITAISIVVGGLWFRDLMAIMAILALGRSLVYCFRFLKILDLVGESFGKFMVPLLKNLPYSIFCTLPVVYAVELLKVADSSMCVITGLFALSMLMAIIPSIKIYIKKGD